MSELEADQIAFRESAREFSENEIRPLAAEMDSRAWFPDDLIARLGEEGFMGMVVPEEFGGLERDLQSCILAIEEISKISPSVALTVCVNNLLTCLPIMRFGTEEQRERYLPRLASGEWLGSFALTEPGAGTDAGSLRTSAKLQGEHYVLNGEKAFITNMGKSSLVQVFARTSEGRRGISTFLVELPREGLVTGEPLEKMGMRGSIQMGFEMRDVTVPAEDLLGEAGNGFKIALWSLDRGRLGVAAQCLGIAQACLDDATEHAANREQFGRPISEFQAIQFSLADMHTELEAARCMTWRAARRVQEGTSTPMDPAMAKLLASRAAVNASGKAMHIMGGRGYLSGCRVERMLRDAMITEIYEGSSEVQRMVIAREMIRHN